MNSNCTHCGKPVYGESYIENGLLYHKECWNKYMALSENDRVNAFCKKHPKVSRDLVEELESDGDLNLLSKKFVLESQDRTVFAEDSLERLAEEISKDMMTLYQIEEFSVITFLEDQEPANVNIELLLNLTVNNKEKESTILYECEL